MSTSMPRSVPVPRHGQPVGSRRRPSAPICSSRSANAHVALHARRAKAFDGDPAAGDGGGAEEVRRGAGVGLDGVRGRPVGLRRDGEVLVGDAERLHDRERHLDVRHRHQRRGQLDRRGRRSSTAPAMSSPERNWLDRCPGSGDPPARARAGDRHRQVARARRAARPATPSAVSASISGPNGRARSCSLPSTTHRPALERDGRQDEPRGGARLAAVDGRATVRCACPRPVTGRRCAPARRARGRRRARVRPRSSPRCRRRTARRSGSLRPSASAAQSSARLVMLFDPGGRRVRSGGRVRGRTGSTSGEAHADSLCRFSHRALRLHPSLRTYAAVGPVDHVRSPSVPSAQPLILAHAFGARYDLPIPLWLFVLGGAVVVVLSFLVAERRTVEGSSMQPGQGHGAACGRSARRQGRARRSACCSLAFFILVGTLGSQEIPENILPTDVLAGGLDRRAADLRPARRLDPDGQPVRGAGPADRPAGAAQGAARQPRPGALAVVAGLVAGRRALLPHRLRRADHQQDGGPAAGHGAVAAGLRAGRRRSSG